MDKTSTSGMNLRALDRELSRLTAPFSALRSAAGRPIVQYSVVAAAAVVLCEVVREEWARRRRLPKAVTERANWKVLLEERQRV